jgi:hypothetical protein
MTYELLLLSVCTTTFMENGAAKQIITIDCEGLTFPEINEINQALKTEPAQFEIRIVRIVELKESFPETRTTLGLVVPHLGLIVTSLISGVAAIARKKAIDFVFDRIEQTLKKRADRKEEELETGVLYQPDGNVLISFKKPKAPLR